MNSRLRAEEPGVELEIVNGSSVWEAPPIVRRRTAVDRIRDSIEKRKETV